MQRIIVRAHQHEGVERRFDPEDCVWVHRPTYAYLVAFREPHGIEWTLDHAFPDSPAGAAHAQRVAAKVQATLDARGITGLDESRWVSRVIYGSAAYQDEEPWIVAREKDDALLSEFSG
jgi:hypothetical protein